MNVLGSLFSNQSVIIRVLFFGFFGITNFIFVACCQLPVARHQFLFREKEGVMCVVCAIFRGVVMQIFLAPFLMIFH